MDLETRFKKAREDFYKVAWAYLGEYLGSGESGVDTCLVEELRGWWEAHPEGWRDTPEEVGLVGQAVMGVFYGLVVGGEATDLIS